MKSRSRCVSLPCARLFKFWWISFCYVHVLVAGNVVPNPAFCNSPSKTGPCRAAFHRWYFNSSSNKCKEFIYGGCRGNKNNFKTEQSCAKTCKPSVAPQPGDHSVEKTIQTYTKLLNDGVRPEEPVPFFSSNKMFRRSIEPQNHTKGKQENQNEDEAPIGLSAQDLDPFFTARHFNLRLRHRRDAEGIKEKDNLIARRTSLQHSNQVKTPPRRDIKHEKMDDVNKTTSEPTDQSKVVDVGGDGKRENGSKKTPEPDLSDQVKSKIGDEEEDEKREGGSKETPEPDLSDQVTSKIGDEEEDEKRKDGSKETPEPDLSYQLKSKIGDEEEEDEKRKDGSKETPEPDLSDQVKSKIGGEGEDEKRKDGNKETLEPDLSDQVKSRIGDEEEDKKREDGSKETSEPDLSNQVKSKIGDEEEDEKRKDGSKETPEPDLSDQVKSKIGGEGEDKKRKDGSKETLEPDLSDQVKSRIGDEEEDEKRKDGSKETPEPDLSNQVKSKIGDEEEDEKRKDGSKETPEPDLSNQVKSKIGDEGEDKKKEDGSKETPEPNLSDQVKSKIGDEEEDKKREDGSKETPEPDLSDQVKSKIGDEEEDEKRKDGSKETPEPDKSNAKKNPQSPSRNWLKGKEEDALDDNDFDVDNPRNYRQNGIYRSSDPLEHTSSHFAAFFLTSIVMVFAAYVVYHNRQKIVAIVIEGRNDSGSRKRGYRKLETNVEEAMPSMNNANSTYVY